MRACSGISYICREGRPHITLCGRNSVQIHERQRPVDFAELSVRLQPHGNVRHNEFVLKFWREPYEMTLFPDGRAIIKALPTRRLRAVCMPDMWNVTPSTIAISLSLNDAIDPICYLRAVPFTNKKIAPASTV